MVRKESRPHNSRLAQWRVKWFPDSYRDEHSAEPPSQSSKSL